VHSASSSNGDATTTTTTAAAVINNVRSTKKRSNYADASFLSLGQAASAGALLLLISAAPNLIAKSTVEEFVPRETVSFADWFVIGAPHAIIGLLISWIIIFLIIKHEIKTLPATRNQFRTSLKSMGRMQRKNAVLAIVIAAMFLWIVPSLLRSSRPFIGHDVFSSITNAFTTNVTAAVPAVMIIMAIATVKIGRNRSSLMRWDEMMRAVY
jgi:solute carrier family 13 (sodium-dependent dicarboxylate transporter), member 2/3/5